MCIVTKPDVGPTDASTGVAKSSPGQGMPPKWRTRRLAINRPFVDMPTQILRVWNLQKSAMIWPLCTVCADWYPRSLTTRSSAVCPTNEGQRRNVMRTAHLSSSVSPQSVCPMAMGS